MQVVANPPLNYPTAVSGDRTSPDAPPQPSAPLRVDPVRGLVDWVTGRPSGPAPTSASRATGNAKSPEMMGEATETSRPVTTARTSGESRRPAAGADASNPVSTTMPQSQSSGLQQTKDGRGQPAARTARRESGDYSFGMGATPQPWYTNLGPWMNSSGQSLYGAVETDGFIGWKKDTTGRPVLDEKGRGIPVRSGAALGSDITQSVLGGAAGLVGMTGQTGLAKGLGVAAAGAGAVSGALRGDAVGATLSGLGGVASLIGGKAGQVLSKGIEVVGTVKNVVGQLSMKGIQNVAGAIGSAAGLAAGFLKGTAGKVASGLATAATVSLQALKGVTSGAISLASGIAGGAVAGIGAIASLVGGRVGGIIGNVATIIAAALMSNPIGAVIGGVALIASLIFRPPRGKYTSDQKADLLGRKNVGDGTAGAATGGGATSSGAGAKPPLDRLHRTKDNKLEVYINDGTGKETKTQTLKMPGYFEKKNQAGQDKLVDLLDRGMPDIIWQGDKKSANNLTTYLNLGGGKFGDPLAGEKAAVRLAAMDEYIKSHPRPVWTGSPASTAPDHAPGQTKFITPPRVANNTDTQMIAKANEWLNGLEAAANAAVKNEKVKSEHPSMSHIGEIGDQITSVGASNPYKDFETMSVDPNDDGATLYTVLPDQFSAKGGESIADVNTRMNKLMDEGAARMRMQVETQAKPEGRVYSEQSLNIQIKRYQPEQLKFSDVNGDGFPDAIMSGKDVQKGTWVFLGQGDGRFAEQGIDVSKELEALKAAQGEGSGASTPPPASVAPPPAPVPVPVPVPVSPPPNASPGGMPAYFQGLRPMAGGPALVASSEN
jgi:hypothetical protein